MNSKKYAVITTLADGKNYFAGVIGVPNPKKGGPDIFSNHWIPLAGNGIAGHGEPGRFTKDEAEKWIRVITGGKPGPYYIERWTDLAKEVNN